MLAPIIVFAYNRPWHVEQTLTALSKNVYADESVLYIYCDGPKSDASDEQKAKIAEVRQVVRKQQWCKEVHVVEFNENKGLARSIVGGVTQIVNQYGRVIVLEDDMITSPGFLQYMNKALDLYEHDDRVMHITGFMFPMKRQLLETFFYEVPHCWSWATWKRAWQFFSDDTSELYTYWSTRWKQFNKWGGTSLQQQLEDNYRGTLRTWFVKWHATVLRMDGLTLYPGISLVKNVGFDGSGDNCGVTTKYDVENMPDSIDVRRIPIKENRRMAKRIKIFQSGHWYSKGHRRALVNRVKKLLRIKK